MVVVGVVCVVVVGVVLWLCDVACCLWAASLSCCRLLRGVVDCYVSYCCCVTYDFFYLRCYMRVVRLASV